MLEMKGSGNRVYYVPTTAFAAARTEDGPDTRQPSTDTHQQGQDSHQAGQDSHQLLATIPAPLRARLPAPGTKPRREAVRALIADLCTWRQLSARELAAILGRQEHKPLVRDYLNPMVAEGTLAYTIPEMENHPEQRYTAAAPGAATE
jgi:ATP-dependent DNA helicase RecG